MRAACARMRSSARHKEEHYQSSTRSILPAQGREGRRDLRGQWTKQEVLAV